MKDLHQIDAAFLVLESELVQILSYVVKVVAGNTPPEEFENKFAWIAWVLAFLAMGLLLYIFRLQGFIPTFHKEATLEEEDAFEEAELFTQNLLLTDRLVTADHFFFLNSKSKLGHQEYDRPYSFCHPDQQRKYCGKDYDYENLKLRRGKNSDEMIVTAPARKLRETSSNYPSDFNFAELDRSSSISALDGDTRAGMEMSSNSKKLEVFVLHDPKHD